MHSFAPTLSFLLSLFLFQLQSQPTALARAAELAPANATNFAARDVNYRRHSSRSRNHAEAGYARNANSDLLLYPGRRAANAKFTYFKTGLGACGGVNVPSDFIVALDMQQFDVDSHCGAAITITINGKVAHATIADRCVGCGFNNLDLTSGLYAFFDPTMDGTLYGEWEFGNGAPTTTPKPTPTPTPTPTPKPTPTSTKTSTRYTSTTSKIKTTSTTTSTTASTTTTSSAITTTTAAAPVPTEVPGNIEQAYLALLGMGGIFIGSLGSSS